MLFTPPLRLNSKKGNPMERDRANSKYRNDPRVEWTTGGGLRTCQIDPQSVPSQLPTDILEWDGVVYSDETIEFYNWYQPTGWHVRLRSPDRILRVSPEDGFDCLDDALHAVLGEPLL